MTSGATPAGATGRGQASNATAIGGGSVSRTAGVTFAPARPLLNGGCGGCPLACGGCLTNSGEYSTALPGPPTSTNGTSSCSVQSTTHSSGAVSVGDPSVGAAGAVR